MRRGRDRGAGRPLGCEPLEDRRLLASVPAGYAETILASGLTSPTTLDIDPDGRVWVAFQDGRIGVIEDGVAGVQQAFALDADGSGERGLQGIEVAPDFETTGHIYVYYTANTPQPHNRLSRLTVDPTTENTILLGSEVVLLDLPDLATYGNPPWHIGGAVHVGLDDTVYVQVGDSQQAALSQDLTSPLGKILRVNPNGSAPTDNPFYDAADGIDWTDYVWSLGLRNPFAGDLHPTTGQYFVADVGASSWEEINDATLPGHDFGWPTTEGDFDPVAFPDFTQPFHTYSHSNGCAITGGAFNTGGTTPFEAQYADHFFFSEFCNGEIRVVDPNDASSVEVFATGAEFPMNIEFGPDGALYYVARGAGAGGAPGIGTGTIRRIAYAVDVPPAIVTDPQDALASVGFPATFSVSAGGTSPLGYQWQVSSGGAFVDIPGATAETLTLPSVSLGDGGNLYRALVTNPLGVATSAAATLTVTADTPPAPFINSPVDTLTYRAGDLITFGGGAFDAEDGALAPAQLTWQVDFHHNDHSHPFIAATSGITGGQFQIPTVTETDDDVWYRITLTATDSAGLQTTVQRDVFPEKSRFVVETNLPDSGGDLRVDGRVLGGPFVDVGVENVQRLIEAEPTQTVDGEPVFFAQWLDGVTTPERTILTPQDDYAYVALYRTLDASVVYLSDLTTSAPPINAWGPIELDTSNGEDLAGDGQTITLNGVEYAKGLGVHAYSELTYSLAGAYQRFVSDVGVDDENAPGGSVVFRVFGDGVELFNSGVMTNASSTQTVNVDVAGVDELRLVVEDAGDGEGNDHADWAGARLTPLAASSVARINFQIDTAATPAGYLADTGEAFGARGGGLDYGWSTDHTDLTRERGVAADARLDTLSHFRAGAEWEIAVPNGQYLVTAAVGDAGFSSVHTLNVEGQNLWSGAALAANEFLTGSQIVVVADGRLTLDQGAAADRSTRINYVEINSLDVGSTLLPYAAADVNLDGRLDLEDAVAFGAGWGADGATATLEQRVRQGDLDFDGDTDADDWSVFERRWLAENKAPLSLSAVLTPSPGDFNRNGTVSDADYDVWRAAYGSSAAAADGNASGRVGPEDFTVWRAHVGSTQQTPTLNEVVLFVDPATGDGLLRNDTGADVALVGYSVLSEGGSLRPANGQWSSLADQGLTGWQEAAPTSTALSELNAFGALTLTAGQTISLGSLVDATQTQSGLSLEYVVDGSAQTRAGYVVFSEVYPLVVASAAAQTAAIGGSTLAQEESSPVAEGFALFAAPSPSVALLVAPPVSDDGAAELRSRQTDLAMLLLAEEPPAPTSDELEGISGASEAADQRPDAIELELALAEEDFGL